MCGMEPEKANRTCVMSDLERWVQTGDEEVAVVGEAVRRNQLSGKTPALLEFEQAWRVWTGARYAVSVFNGTMALYSAYFALGVRPGDEVICPVNTWICSISPAVMLGATPVFCDIDPETLLMDPADVARRITPRTRCICAVHLWGNVCNMPALAAVAGKVPIVEDCSHAPGARYDGVMCGTMGAVGCWSLQQSKPVSAGEGGVLVTNSADLYERACFLGQTNRLRSDDIQLTNLAGYGPLGLGMKLRAHPLGLAVGNVQMHKFPALNRRRRAYVEAVEAGLSKIPGLHPLSRCPLGERSGFYAFPVIHDPSAMGGMSTADFVREVNACGVPAIRERFPLLHRLPLFAEGTEMVPALTPGQYLGYKPGQFPNAEHAQERTVFLPVLSDPVPEAVDAILGVLDEVARR